MAGGGPAGGVRSGVFRVLGLPKGRPGGMWACGHVTTYAMDQPSPRTAPKPTGVRVSVTTLTTPLSVIRSGEYVRGEVHPNGMEGRRPM